MPVAAATADAGMRAVLGESILKFPSPDADTYDGPAADTESTSSEAVVDWSDAGRSKAPDDEDARPQLEANHCTLREHLMEQMRVTVLEMRDRALVELIIDALDENGYPVIRGTFGMGDRLSFTLYGVSDAEPCRGGWTG